MHFVKGECHRTLTECLFTFKVRGGGSTHLNAERDKRETDGTAANTEPRQLYCQQNPSCDVKTQKMHKHRARHTHRHAQAA